jgi:hypothetical protein
MPRTKRLPSIAMLRALRRRQERAMARLLAARPRLKAAIWKELLRGK